MTFAEPNETYAKSDTTKANPDAEVSTDTKDVNGVPTGAWAADFCGCIDSCVPNALMAFLCPGVSLAQILARLGLVPFMNVIAVFVIVYVAGFLACATGWFLFQLIISILSIAIAIGVTKLRLTVRRLFSIPGEVWGDLLLAFICGPCTIAQIATHVSSYTPGSCDFRPRETLPGYSWN